MAFNYYLLAIPIIKQIFYILKKDFQIEKRRLCYIL